MRHWFWYTDGGSSTARPGGHGKHQQQQSVDTTGGDSATVSLYNNIHQVSPQRADTTTHLMSAPFPTSFNA